MINSPIIKRAGIVTWTVTISCALVTLMTKTGTRPITLDFLFIPDDIFHGQFWRLITPAFVHFVIMDSYFIHLLFNALVWLNFAGGIESIEGKKRLLGLFLFSAIVSNTAAYLAYGPAFGGLSGVNFALVGYLFLRVKNVTRLSQIMPKNMAYPFIAFMLIGFTGLLGNMANVAHLAGFISGVAFAIIMNVKIEKR